jgi:hypothetical protein
MKVRQYVNRKGKQHLTVVMNRKELILMGISSALISIAIMGNGILIGGYVVFAIIFAIEWILVSWYVLSRELKKEREMITK